MNQKIQIMKDELGHQIVVLPDIIFKNRQNIDWRAVEEYLKQYIGQLIEIVETKDIIYIGRSFPDEYKGSEYTRKIKGTRAKAKANAVQGIIQMLQTATDKRFSTNKADKHKRHAEQGWYYYTTYFALPVYQSKKKTDIYNVYSGCLLVNHSMDGRKYLYDLVDVKKIYEFSEHKKEASTPFNPKNR